MRFIKAEAIGVVKLVGVGVKIGGDGNAQRYKGHCGNDKNAKERIEKTRSRALKHRRIIARVG